MPTHVVDTHSNHEEIVERLAKIVGRSPQRQAVFLAVYGRAQRSLTFEEVQQKIQPPINQQSCRNHLARLANHSLISKVSTNGRVTYGKLDAYVPLRDKIINFARNPDKAKALPTKRRPQLTIKIASKTISVPQRLVNARQVTIDDIDSFSLVRNVRADSNLADELTEDAFKVGIQKIISEKGTFKDWGGETSDLMTTRLIFEGRRVPAAFAFKGPGLKATLTIAKMGKNGDQGPRLFQEPADLFIVQHCREIAPAVTRLIQAHAELKSVYVNRQIIFCIIDGVDSKRIVEAYRQYF